MQLPGPGYHKQDLIEILGSGIVAYGLVPVVFAGCSEIHGKLPEVLGKDMDGHGPHVLRLFARYSNIIISLGVLIVAFVFVVLYRRRHY